MGNTKEKFTIVKDNSDTHYDTNDERFYSGSWERTFDTEKYLKMLMENNPAKFKDCHIEANNG